MYVLSAVIMPHSDDLTVSCNNPVTQHQPQDHSGPHSSLTHATTHVSQGQGDH